MSIPTDTLRAINLHGTWCVTDDTGGIWHPTEPAPTADEALRLCRTEPMSGVWCG